MVPDMAHPSGTRAMPALLRAVRRFGAVAVPAARDWAASDREWLAEFGREVLREFGGPEVLPGLLAELEQQGRDGSWCGPGITARHLIRFGAAAAEAVPVLRAYWIRSPHSYERASCLEALAAIDPTGSGMEYAFAESLWDCEEQARLLGIAHAPDVPELVQRIAVLRDDPMEEPQVRAAARARLPRG
ncbi:hypothetical protein ACFV7Q_38610, partial [Streptomyces sp. NPDC059851]